MLEQCPLCLQQVITRHHDIDIREQPPRRWRKISDDIGCSLEKYECDAFAGKRLADFVALPKKPISCYFRRCIERYPGDPELSSQLTLSRLLGGDTGYATQ